MMRSLILVYLRVSSSVICFLACEFAWRGSWRIYVAVQYITLHIPPLVYR